MLRNSLIALGLGMLGILIYVTMRFEFSFALGALVALLHDVIITIGVFALFGRELSLIIVGAVLTIAGYSVNDTIVVFDRIREGINNGRRGSILEIMNLSINETLSRTILTGGVTLLHHGRPLLFRRPGAERLRLRDPRRRARRHLLLDLHRGPDRPLVEQPRWQRSPHRDRPPVEIPGHGVVGCWSSRGHASLCAKVVDLLAGPQPALSRV